MNIHYVLLILAFLYSDGTDNIHRITYRHLSIYTYIHKTFSSHTYKHSPCIICYRNHYHRVFLRDIDFSPKKSKGESARERELERKIQEKFCVRERRNTKENTRSTARTSFFGRASVRCSNINRRDMCRNEHVFILDQIVKKRID